MFVITEFVITQFDRTYNLIKISAELWAFKTLLFSDFLTFVDQFRALNTALIKLSFKFLFTLSIGNQTTNTNFINFSILLSLMIFTNMTSLTDALVDVFCCRNSSKSRFLSVKRRQTSIHLRFTHSTSNIKYSSLL